MTEQEIYLRAVGIRGLIAAKIGAIAGTTRLLQIRRPDVRHPFWIRVPSTDVPTLDQIFVRQEYAFDVTRPPGVIVDAGANIGLASIYFSNKFPDARIFAIEPEGSNLAILERNVAPYPNITVVRGALWHENARLKLVDPGLGHWAFATEAHNGVGGSRGEFIQDVQGMKLDEIMNAHGIDHIDILKMDIEGAEREVFSDPSAWIGKVDALIVELHERWKPGCNRSFYNGSNGFDDEWIQGENVYLTRSRSGLTRRRG